MLTVIWVKIKYIEAYLKANKMFRDYNQAEQDPLFSEVSTVWTCDTFENNSEINQTLEKYFNESSS